ncbi:MAG: aspartate/glutamate racemase family protein [Thermoplasmata archaeon]|uniref:aspartate/glutamate racemase family protein n=1 Tax=Caldisericum sp. TaxID=2499687 RepID=UPI003CA5619B
MSKKILWINPVGTDLFDRPIKDYLNEVKNSDTYLEVISFKRGPHHLEYQFYESLVGLDILRSIKLAEKDGYDAAVIGCFYDPFLSEAREISNIVVTAPAESSFAIAISLGHKFSILVGRRKWIPQMEENVIKYGLKERLASFRSIDMGVLEFQKRKEETEKRLITEAKKAIEEDGAEVIILGCTAEFGFYKKMEEKLGVPVIDATIAPLKYAEFLVELKKISGISHSRKGKYEMPPTEEIKNWNIEEHYQFKW